MTHEFSNEPIKLRYIDLKNGEILRNIIFIGNVPDVVERELKKIEISYNKNSIVKHSAILKKFYGVNWEDKLGFKQQLRKIKGRYEAEGIKGGKQNSEHNNTPSDYIADKLITIRTEIYGGIDELKDEVDNLQFELSDDLFADMDFSSNNSPKSNNSPTSSNTSSTDTSYLPRTNSTPTILSPIKSSTINGVDRDINGVDRDINGVDITDHHDKMQSSDMVTADDIEILEEDITFANDKRIDLLEDLEKTMEIKLGEKGNIKFVFDQCVYPVDNFLDFKYKIYIATGIPIYRQHVWFKYHDRSYAMNYNLLSHKHDEYVNVETLIAFYAGEKKLDEIEGIPVNLDYYKNKDFMQVQAQDRFALLGTTYYKYGTNEYFFIDLNDLINPMDIYTKLHKDKYQLEVIYYGFIMVYFPIITFTVFLDYLKNERAVPTIYPELKPDKLNLIKQYQLEANLTNQSLHAFSTYENAKSPYSQIYKKLFSSITETMLSIDNYKQDIELLLVLRNLFDIIELSDIMPYCKANLLYDNKHIILRKSYFNEQEPSDIIPLNSILIKIKTNSDTNENMRLILFKNGNYNIKTEWREENHMNFDNIVDVVAKKINPVIQMINKMDDKVKYHNLQIPEFTKRNAIFTETSLVFYYDDDTTEARFNIFKRILEDYNRAKLITSKENVGMGYEYFFNKGMYMFDSTRIEKAITLNNYYDYLSNGVVKQKWMTIFEKTRLFQVNNISSKLKITINGIRNDVEMEIFHMYLIGILSLYEQQSEKIKIQHGETLHNKSKKTLKNLKIQDPLLYDFKKIYKSNVIYSKICQKPYQPLIITDEEYKQLPEERRKNAVLYWNFTKQKPTWYSCPNAKFPYIKFIIKQHPKDYCIPCCKKVAMTDHVNKKKQEIHNICMKEHKFVGEKVSLTKGSHYIATYGKNIETGRLSRLPEHTLEPLFFDTYSPESGIDQECVTSDGYYLFGVDQQLLTIENIGYLFCLVHAMQNKSVDNFLKETCEKIKKNPDKFRVILDGNIGLYFDNANHLADTMLLLNTNTIIQNKLKEINWNDLFISIAYYYYGINTIIFEDKQKELIDLVLSKGLKNVDEMFPDSHKNLVVLRKSLRYNPIYLINTEIFKRIGIIDTRLFLNESGLITIIRAVVRSHFEKTDYDKIRHQIDLSIIKEFSVKTGIKIKSYFINYSNLCYGVLLEYKNIIGYLPIFPSHYPLDKEISLIFTPYSNKYAIEYSDLNKITSQYNNWVLEKSKKEGLINIYLYPLIKVEYWLLSKDIPNDKNIIGFYSGEMYYYCENMTEKTARNIVDQPIQKTLYSPLLINELIYSIKNGTKKMEINQMLEDKLQISNYHYYLYHLVILQFINMFNKEVNKPLRKKLFTILAKTNFDKDMHQVREFIKTISDVEDINKLKNIISRFITTHHDKKIMYADIQETKFNFDRVNLEKLKTLKYEEVLSKIRQMASTSIKVGEVHSSKSKPFVIPNILTACSSKGGKNAPDYCASGKLIVPKDKLEEILKTLAYDIINPSKWKWLFNSIFVEKTIDYFRFIQRPAETITVETVI